MKRILKYLIVLLLICSSFRKTYAQECEDMSKWSFKILLQNADQMDELKIVRYRNKESGRYGFCMEPEVDFSPRDNEYFRNDLKAKMHRITEKMKSKERSHLLQKKR